MCANRRCVAHLADYGVQLHGAVGIDIAWAMARAHAIKKCRSRSYSAPSRLFAGCCRSGFSRDER
ncbi:hypothetical protein, partial [Xanthomonas graminis]|uniref:hypothetical protein n=1 Tax=Xanthomonas graminis TaxID=3390026 RepID=UPI001E605A5A